jgi:RepB DNA-primase from phage plasmid
MSVASDGPLASRRPDESLVVRRDGTVRRACISGDEQAALWATALHQGRPGLVELVTGRRHADGLLVMRARHERERFPRAGDTAALVALVRHHRGLGEEVFCTPLTRRRARPGRGGQVLPGAVAWIDIDEPANVERVRRFAHRPHMVVRPGSGGLHAYWRLAAAVELDELEAVNRKLAGHLGADDGVWDRARIMRVPGTVNAKAGRPCRLAYLDLAARPVAAAVLVDGLRDPDPPPPPPDPQTVRRWVERSALDDARRVPPPLYFRLLAGVEVPDRGGDVRCPLPDHDEQHPSCRVYPTPERGWVCFGCQRGGSIYDLASLLERGPGGRRGALHGDEFKRVKRRVRELLGLAADEHDRPRPATPAHADAHRPTATEKTERRTA